MIFNIKRLRPKEIEIYGEKYPLMLTMEALAELESITNKTFSNIFTEFTDDNTLSIKTIQAVLYVMLKGGGVDLELADLSGVPFTHEIIQTLSDAMVAQLPVVEKSEDTILDKKKKNPPLTGSII